MTRNRALTIAGVAAGAALVAWLAFQHKHEIWRKTPDWTDPQQPVEGTAGQPANNLPAVPSPTAAWNAVRPGTPHMRAGSRVIRTYPGNLVDDPESLVR